MRRRVEVESAESTLKKARDAFNGYMDATVKPLLQIDQCRLDRMRFVEIGKRIVDPSIRREYRERAVSLLEANIESSGPSARLRDVPEPDMRFVVATTLVAAALAFHFGNGAFSGLLAAALWYWLAAETAFRRRRELLIEIREHNDEVPVQQKTIEDWKADLFDLRLLD